MVKPKVILTDLDGVLRTYPNSHSADVESVLGLEPGGLLQIAFQTKFLEPAITGKIIDETWRNQIVAELSKKFEISVVESAIARWSAFPGKLEDEVHSIYRSKKGACKLALLTNATTKLNDDLRLLGIFDLFDRIYNTSEIGFAKPDPRVFHHVLKTIGHSADEILFIDDRSENIEVAENLGFKVHLFETHQSLQAACKSYL